MEGSEFRTPLTIALRSAFRDFNGATHRFRISDTCFTKQLKLLISEEQNLLSAGIERNASGQKCVFPLSVNFEDFVETNFFKNRCPPKQEISRHCFTP